MKDFLSIREFSKFSGIESSTLRYWDEIGLFSPIKRDEENNYRYYSPEQIITVNFISVLSRVGIPLKIINEMKDIRNPQNIIELIDNQELYLDSKMQKLAEAYSIMHARKKLIKEGLKVDSKEISVVTRQERIIVLGPQTDFTNSKTFYEPFKKFCNEASKLRINLHYPVGGYHKNFASFAKSPGCPERFFSIDPSGNHKIVSREYLVGYTKGYYGDFGDLPERMLNYVKENNLILDGPSYSIYLFDEICTKNNDEYLVEVSVAINRQ